MLGSILALAYFGWEHFVRGQGLAQTYLASTQLLFWANIATSVVALGMAVYAYIEGRRNDSGLSKEIFKLLLFSPLGVLGALGIVVKVAVTVAFILGPYLLYTALDGNSWNQVQMIYGAALLIVGFISVHK